MLSRLQRLVTMRDVFSRVKNLTKYIVIPVITVLNIVRSMTDVLGSYTLAKAVDAIATNKPEPELFGEPVSTVALLYVSAGCFTYSRVTPFLIRFIVTPARKEMTKETIGAVLRKTHRLTYTDTIKNKSALEQSIQYSRDISELILLIPNNIHQPIFSIICGSIIILYEYNVIIGTSFLGYTILKSGSGFFAHTVLKLTEKIRSSNEKFSTLVQKYKESVSNVEVVKVFHRENVELDMANSLIDDYLSDYIKSIYKENVAYLSTNAVPTIADFLVITYMLSQENLNLLLPQLVFLLNYLAVVNINSSRFIEASYNSMKLMTAHDEIKKILVLPEEDRSEEEADSTWLENALTSGPTVSFEHVFFRYDAKSVKFILNDVSFEIAGGQNCAIVGSSSSGKSTIVKLLLRQYRPESGKIKINDKDINTVPIDHLYRIMSFLSQDVRLFENNTIQFNVAYGFVGEEKLLHKMSEKSKKNSLHTKWPSIDDITPFSSSQEDFKKKEKSYKMSKKSHKHSAFSIPLLLAETVQQSPRSPHSQSEYKQAVVDACIDLDADENVPSIMASALSGGQKQRVAFARSLLRKATILIFDEPTSALDSEIEENIINTINKSIKGKTSIMIAHRLNTIINSDKIIVLDQGKVVQEGKHNELINVDGKYQTFWNIQTGKVAHQMSLGGIIKSSEEVKRSACNAQRSKVSGADEEAVFSPLQNL